MGGFYADLGDPTMPLPDSWLSISTRLSEGYVQALERRIPAPFYPPRDQWYRALELCPLDRVKVVILGQDPYHGLGQAEGLSFSVAQGKWPPSLVNIFKELQDDLDCQPPFSGSLIPWAEQGVLLLNRVLTVAPNQAGSHQGMGWEAVTSAIIESLTQSQRPIVYLLWGKPAQSVLPLIPAHQLALCAPHPSPLSSYRGFFGSQPFSKANQFLVKNGRSPINWSDV